MLLENFLTDRCFPKGSILTMEDKASKPSLSASPVQRCMRKWPLPNYSDFIY